LTAANNLGEENLDDSGADAYLHHVFFGRASVPTGVAAVSNVTEQLIKHAPKYVAEVYTLLIEPTKFVATRCRKKNSGKPLYFLLYSVILVAIAVGVLCSLKAARL
jgi:hypothetical protein